LIGNRSFLADLTSALVGDNDEIFAKLCFETRERGGVAGGLKVGLGSLVGGKPSAISFGTTIKEYAK
jgi:hypothetical protein